MTAPEDACQYMCPALWTLDQDTNECVPCTDAAPCDSSVVYRLDQSSP